MVEALSDWVGDGADLFGAVVGGVDVDPEGPLAFGEADDAGDLAGDLDGVGVSGGAILAWRAGISSMMPA